MKLSKQTSDAIQILTYCHRQDGRLVKVAEVADTLGLKKQMALKLANILAQAGFVETVRGPSGGIRLSEATRAATLGHIVRTLEAQPTSRADYNDGGALDSFVDEAFEAFLQVLDRHSLAEMAARGASAVKPKANKSESDQTTRQRSSPLALKSATRRPGRQTRAPGQR